MSADETRPLPSDPDELFDRLAEELEDLRGQEKTIDADSLALKYGVSTDDVLACNAAIDGLAGALASSGSILPRPAGHFSQSALDAAPGVRVGDYQLERELGRGGMGVVYLARHVETDERVALKLLLMGERASYMQRGRFIREAESTQRLDHPGIIKVLDHGTAAGTLFLAMEYVEGPTLADVIDGLKLPDLVALLAKIARAVGHAHAQGIVHRDLKPGNVLIRERDGTPIVTDFGLARPLDRSSLTETGVVMGTPHYLSPEQAGDSKSVTSAADVYSLGAILYEGLTGSPPFAEIGAVLQLIQAIRERDPKPPSEANHRVPRALEDVCLRALAKHAEGRYADGAELADALDAVHSELWGDARDLPVLPAPQDAPQDAEASARGEQLKETSSKVVAAVRWGFFGTLGLTLFSLSLCCLASGAFCLTGHDTPDQRLADAIAQAPVLSAHDAALATGLVCVEDATATVDSALVVNDTPCLYVSTRAYGMKTVETIARDGSKQTRRVRASTFGERREAAAVTSFSLGELVVRPQGAQYFGLVDQLERTEDEELEHDMLLPGRRITVAGQVQDGVMSGTGDALVIGQEVSRDELVMRLETGVLQKLVGKVSLGFGALFLLSALMALALRQSRSAEREPIP